jgi:hypothetical protein
VLWGQAGIFEMPEMWIQGNFVNEFLKIIICIVATEAIVQLVFNAVPIQGARAWAIARLRFLYSKQADEHLFECRYCVSVWIGFLVAGLYFLMSEPVVLFVCLALVFHRGANFLHLGFSYLRDRQLDIRIDRKRKRGEHGKL